MARKDYKSKTKEAPVRIESAADTGSASHGSGMPTSKSDAVRMAIVAGFGGPHVGACCIQSQLGLAVRPEHFSTVKSADMKKILTETPAAKPGRKTKAEPFAKTEPDLLEVWHSPRRGSAPSPVLAKKLSICALFQQLHGRLMLQVMPCLASWRW